MDRLRFSWDPNKAAANLRKHGISFDEAETVFSDEYGIVIDDPDDVSGEYRFLLIGLSAIAQVLTVCHCLQDGDVIRIINARRATKTEQRQYWERLMR